MAEASSAVSLTQPPLHLLTDPLILGTEVSVSRAPLQVQSCASEGDPGLTAGQRIHTQWDILISQLGYESSY